MQELETFRAIRTALDNSQAIVEFDVDGFILSANNLFIEGIGFSEHAVIGAHHSKFIAPEEIESTSYKDFWRRLRNGEFQQGEFRRIGAKGEEWISASYTPILDDNGKVFKIIKFATFITDRKRENMDFAGQIAAIGRSQAVVEFSMDGTILRANDLFLNAMGYTSDEVVGRHHAMFLEPHEADSAEYKSFWEDLRAGKYRAAEFERIGKGGREVWIQASYTPIIGTSGKPFKIVKYATIVTDQRLKAADYQGQIEAIGLSQAVVEFDMEGNIQNANSIFLREMGYSLEEIQDRHHRMFIDAEATDTAGYEKFWRDLRNGQFQTGEFKRITKDGADVWINASYTPILDLNDRPFKVVKYATFITEEVRRKEQLKETQRELKISLAELTDTKRRIEAEAARQVEFAEHMAKARDNAESASQAKSEFLAMMSHELRTPLNAIIGFSEMMKMEPFGNLGDERYLKYTDDIFNSATHLMSLINDLLDISAIEAGKRALSIVNFDACAIIDECIAQLVTAAETKNIHLDVLMDSRPITMSADKRSVFQIALNLLSNAIKYTPQGGRVELTLHKDRNDALLVVRDNGEGIPEDVLKKIMEPFVRAHTDSHLTSSGTGLGLSIVKALVDSHHGEFTLESEAGKGTQATVRIPANIIQLIDKNEFSA